MAAHVVQAAMTGAEEAVFVLAFTLPVICATQMSAAPIENGQLVAVMYDPAGTRLSSFDPTILACQSELHGLRSCIGKLLNPSQFDPLRLSFGLEHTTQVTYGWDSRDNPDEGPHCR